ncbi:MAG: MBOAT family protein [Leptospiraceae bacterium]|nr:MBOAT family protein [Leptospiraceae bacterium]
MLVSTIVDYIASNLIVLQTTPRKKKFFLILSIVSNLSILGFFKYYNFFTLSAKALLESLGFHVNFVLLEFALPLGISFYTFQTMSYTIDVYRGQVIPTKNFIDFALYVSFFPQLVAGPIERATNLLPQVIHPRTIKFQQLQEGAYLVLLGYFKKVYIADNLSFIVDPIYANSQSNGLEVVFASLVFLFQIYGDFAGYSDIARGTAKFMGFELMQNFRNPLLAINVGDFWRRWHISFMTWLRDYVYFSIGDKSDSESKKHGKNLLVFFLSGLWHGANWTFVIWGILNGVIYSIYRIIHPFIPQLDESKNRYIAIFGKILFTFLTSCAIFMPLIYFRSTSLELAWIHTKSLFVNFGSLDTKLIYKFLKNVVLLVVLEIFQFRSDNEFIVFQWKTWLRVLLYITLFYAIVILGNFDKNAFIYFVF